MRPSVLRSSLLPFALLSLITCVDVQATTVGGGPGPNTPPVVQPLDVSGTLVPTGSSVGFTTSFTDDPLQTFVVTVDWGDGSMPQQVQPIPNQGAFSVVASHAYQQAGVYSITLTVFDGFVQTTVTSSQFVVVYDVDGGFVTGGGWIDSPAGAYARDASASGHANFGFVSKYHKGASVPSGSTEFNFQAARMNFHSTAYEWLVVAGAKAMYKGTGTINGDGNYSFMLSAVDGQVGGGRADRIRIRIWDDSGLIYDNEASADPYADPTTTLNGSVVIHK